MHVSQAAHSRVRNRAQVNIASIKLEEIFQYGVNTYVIS
jgi:hypothetical protein